MFVQVIRRIAIAPDFPAPCADDIYRVIFTASAMLAADMAMRLRETLEAPSRFAFGIR